MGDKDAIRCDFETDGDVQVFSPSDLFVRHTVVVGVFEDQQFVVRQRVADAVVRITRHGGDPQATLIVERHLGRISEIGEAMLVGEELDFVAGSGRDL